ncbi:MAG: phosphate ABC transporter permease PstA [Tepidanaerobacteraceae bacterium]|jgi:phosphate transport system permease protein|nr:phosphate ABC transporter permease PstA [Tepidanaerobacteraceae bacterium]
MINARTSDKIATFIFYAMAVSVSLILLALVGFILFNGLRVINLHFLTSPPSAFRAGGGIGPQIFNSFLILILTMIFTIPIGLGAGIYLAEFSRENRWTRIIRICTETLASLPSIVIGLFGLLFFVTVLKWGFSLISGALALTVLNLPVMTRISEDTLRSVKNELREASLALGATQWQTIVHVVLVAAIPGLVTGVILTAGRVFGEAAALLYTAGITTPRLQFYSWNPFNSNSPFYLFRPAETLAVHIWKVNSEGLAPDARQIADGASAVLIIIVLFFNIAARWMARRLYKKTTGI